MTTIKISELPQLQQIRANTAQTLLVGVDTPSDTTVNFTLTSLAQILYANNILNVGQNPVLFTNLISQFSGSDPTFLQVNMQNFNSSGSMDVVLTTNDGDNSNNYIDLGINNSAYSDPNFSSMSSHDGYLYVAGNTTSSIGNLIIGTKSPSTGIKLIAGGTQTSNIIGTLFPSLITLTPPLVVTSNISTSNGYIFSDGTYQKTAASPVSYSQSSFGTANNANANTVYLQGALNTTNTNLTAANTFLQSYAKSYTDTANTFLQANTGLALITAKAYTDTANTFLKTYAVQNTSSIVILGDLTTSSGTITANNLHFGYELVATSNATFRTTSGTNNSKNITISAGADLGGYQGGSVTIRSGGSVSPGGVSGDINLIPGIGYSSNGTVNIDGKLQVNNAVIFANTQFTATQSALTIAACPIGDIQLPSNDGYMLHISGKQNVSSRIVFDSFGANTYAVVAGRTARGTPTAPQAVANNDILMRISGNGYGTTKYSTLGSGRIDIVATENFTDTSRATQIQFFTTPTGSNTQTQIAAFNGTTASFTGVVNPTKGFIYNPNVISGIINSLTIDIANNSLYKFTCNATTTISLSGYQYGKIVEVWMINVDNNNHTVTHGCLANNSTVGATSFTLTAGHCAHLKYFSVDGDQANTFVSINYS